MALFVFETLGKGTGLGYGLCLPLFRTQEARGLWGRWGGPVGGGGLEEVLVALGAAEDEAAAPLESREVTDSLTPGVQTDVREVAEVAQWQADHVDGEALLLASRTQGGRLEVHRLQRHLGHGLRVCDDFKAEV